MDISAHFAFQALLCAGLSILLWSACAGIGRRLLPADAIDRPADAPATWRHAGVAACVGLGALLAIGGVGTLIGLPWWLYVVPFIAAGLALEIGRLAGLRRLSVPRSVVLVGGCVVLAFGAVAYVESIVGLRFPLGPCDDLRAYLPMAQRLLGTGSLNEPWSVRRAQSLGGFDLLRALPVAGFGNQALGVAETAIASVFLAGIFIPNGRRAMWTRVLGIGLILAVIFVCVPRANTTGVLMGVPLLVALLAITAEMRFASRSGREPAGMRWAAVSGLVIASLLSLRPTLGLAGALIVGLGALTVPSARVASRLTAVAAAGVTTLLAVGSWSIAMWRSVGTPLYPAFNGNLNTAALQWPNPGTSERLHRMFALFGSGPYGWVMLGVLVVAIAAWAFLPDAALIVFAVVAMVVVTLATGFQELAVSAQGFARYTAPMSEALAVFLVCELLRAFGARELRVHHAPVPVAMRVLAIVVAVALAGASFSKLNLSWTLLPGGNRLVAQAARSHRSVTPVQSPDLRRSYRDAVASTHGERTISALDRPYLIHYGNDDIPNLDAPGFMTPSGTFPFFTGPGPKIAALRRSGFSVLLVTDPQQDICMAPSRLAAPGNLNSTSGGIYRRFLDWQQDIETIETRAPDAVQRFGSVLRIDLDRAQADLTT